MASSVFLISISISDILSLIKCSVHLILSNPLKEIKRCLVHNRNPLQTSESSIESCTRLM